MRIGSRTIRGLINYIATTLGYGAVAHPRIPEDNRILFHRRYRDGFGFLANFYRASIKIDVETWPHFEAYYQAQKSENPDYRREVLRNDHPAWAKSVGESRIGHPHLARELWFRKHPEDLRLDWEGFREEVMYRAVTAKFSQNQNLQIALLETSQAELIEDTQKGWFWGAGGDMIGENRLDMLFMKIRYTFDSRNGV